MRAIKLVISLHLIASVAAYASEKKESGHEAPAAAEHGEKKEEGHGDAHHEEEERMTELAARTSSRDVKVPRALVGKIEEEYKAFLKKADPAAKTEGIKRGLLNIKAELTQKNPGALHENTRVNTPTGGGVIDLSEVITPVRGAFRMKLQVKREDGHELTAPRVFFVSKAKTRILGGEEYGAGCDKFMDISSQFQKKWGSKGLELYTADQRYLSVVGGTFIFAEYDKEALYVGSVTFNDARYPELLCE